MRTGFRNSEGSFGHVTRALHWTIAVGVLGMLALGGYITRMEVGMSNFWLFGLHKSIGLTLLMLMILRIGWHLVSPPPHPLPAQSWKDQLARWVHRGFYILLLLVPLTGWIASAASGIDVVVFDRLTLPQIAPTSEAIETAFFSAHWVLTKLLAALAIAHIAGALTRRDGTLRRMVRGTAT
ncbi:MAG: cytochrome b/b6 domain-containing protein [Pseudomonadota bacterium]